MEEKIIKSKERVLKHGEVFTPAWVVRKMLDVPEIKQANQELLTTFLEPAAGEGAFLTELLHRKLTMVAKRYNQSLAMYENYALLALSTLYGIELLQDNLDSCQMRVYEVFYEHYKEQGERHGGRLKKKVRQSADVIIRSNIKQGNFLTRKSRDGSPIQLSEWKPVNLRENSVSIRVQRTEYTLQEIYEAIQKEPGVSVGTHKEIHTQLDFFGEEDKKVEEALHYTPVPITEVYKEEMERSSNGTKA